MISVGVSGHIHLHDEQAVVNGVDIVLCTIVAAFDDSTIRVISPLAEGADRVVVWRTIAYFPSQLVVPLPLDKSDYMLDFKTKSSKAEFLSLLEQAEQVIELPDAGSREACYLAAGMYVLDHSDVLIAVWDGQGARGVGGTAEVVAEARRRSMPVAWIQVPAREPELAGRPDNQNEKLQIHYERFPERSS